ncbi:M48 family metalloprotease [Micromonospora chokoriensis]|uniref:Zn-dependent protease with chaperone function n=1 Tax=Micromonospora chokoriensis TaxID=356851 RepID=A0A1C4X0L3_9ACTN|nr:M48 family metalloprotease [Micromonospora chokoriensis]SCF01641.1 Zn-dependent protease with chaperone function [Micromonospora chokoriensis]
MTKPHAVPPESTPPTVPQLDVRAAEPPAADPPSTGTGFADRPPGYPSALVWLRAGILRDWRGVLGAFVATWFYLPVALLLAFWGGLSFGIVGLFAGGLGADDQVPQVLRDAPLIGSLLESFLSRSGGVLGGVAGFAVGFLVGFVSVLVLPWIGGGGPIPVVTGLIGTVAAAALIGVLYTLYRVLLEPRLLVVSGARQPSRREAARLRPVLEDCARRLGLPSVPRLLMEDDPVLSNARTYARHVVVTTAVLTEPDDEISALFSHELVHWRTGDEITSAFVRGVGLPLTLAHALPAWLMRTFPHPGTNFVVFLFFWPVLLTMRYVVLPLHARDVRAAEYRADLGAVLSGHVEAMRRILERRLSFETGRSGWDEAVCATHPPHELRLDALERATVTGAPTGVAEPVTVERLFHQPGPVGTRRTWLLVGVLALVACAGTGGLGVVQWAFFRPQAAVEGFFSALADRDSEAALGHLTDQGAGTDTTLLDRLLRGEGYQPPTDVEVSSLERDGDKATATVAYRLADARQTATLTLERDKESTAGLFHGWRLTGGPIALNSSIADPGVRLNGVELPVATEGPPLVLLPGVYTATGPSNALSETPTATVVADPGQSAATLQLTPVLKPAAVEAVDAQVRAWLDECAKQTVAAPPGCPFRYYGGSAQKVTWKILEYPKLALELTGPASAQVTTPSETRGRVQVSGTTTYFGTSSPFTDDNALTVTGVATADGDAVTFRPASDD